MTSKNSANQLAKECLITALVQLLHEKKLSEISISELTKKAGVSRMTYYRNYVSKEDIIMKYLAEIFTLYHQEFKQQSDHTNFYDMPNMLHCFQYFSAYKDFINTLFLSGLGDLFLSNLTKYILSLWYKEGDSLTHYYTLLAFAGSLCSIYLAWMKNDSSLPVEELARIIHSIYS
ncbi:MAG TPA: TetR/AcrR family transcriptional regulator [Candidatus Dorea intestinavium]|nr:TetR/AcrR family transcriptional regulator [Candidatus Dorea intestinavium]